MNCPAVPEERPTASTPYVWVLSFFLALFALTNCGFDTSEGGDHYEVAEQLLAHGRISFDEPQNGIFTTAPDGRIYGSHEIGNTLFLLPVAALNRVLQAEMVRQGRNPFVISRVQSFVLSFQAGLYSALTASLFFVLLCRHFHVSVRTSFLATLGLATCTFFWTYSRNLYDGVLCSTLLVGSFLCLLEYKCTRRTRFVVATFVLLGFAFITRSTLLLAVLASLIHLFSLHLSAWRHGIRPLGIACLSLLPFVAWHMWYNAIRTGSPFTSPMVSGQYSELTLDGNILVGIAGYLLSPGKSIFVFAPPLLLSVWYAPQFYRTHPLEARYILLLFIAWLVIHSMMRTWFGNWGWGPRYFSTILPLLLIPAAANTSAILASRFGKAAILLSGGCGFLLAASSIVSNWHFRMLLAVQDGLHADDSFIWSGRNNQAVDMLQGAFENILVCLGMKAPRILPDVSEFNNYASNTVNVWANMVVRAGVSPWLAGFVCILLLLLMGVSGYRVAMSDSRGPVG